MAVDTNNTLAALEKFGGTPEQLEIARAQLQQREANFQFRVWPENWRAFELFASCESQWQIIPPALGGKPYWQGIPSTEIESVVRRFPATEDTEVPGDRRLFNQIRLLEQTAKQCLNEG